MPRLRGHFDGFGDEESDSDAYGDGDDEGDDFGALRRRRCEAGLGLRRLRGLNWEMGLVAIWERRQGYDGF